MCSEISERERISNLSFYRVSTSRYRDNCDIQRKSKLLLKNCWKTLKIIALFEILNEETIYLVL